MTSTQYSQRISKHQNVYIVDGDSSARKGLSKLLTVAGFQVQLFASIDEFFQIETIDSHSCLVIDTSTKGFPMDDQQTEWFKKLPNIPIIFLSAIDEKASLEIAVHANAAGFFRKPVDGAALVDAISWGLENKKPSSQAIKHDEVE